jgi:hypothetical protein
MSKYESMTDFGTLTRDENGIHYELSEQFISFFSNPFNSQLYKMYLCTKAAATKTSPIAGLSFSDFLSAYVKNFLVYK